MSLEKLQHEVIEKCGCKAVYADSAQEKLTELDACSIECATKFLESIGDFEVVNLETTNKKGEKLAYSCVIQPSGVVKLP
ncbi:MAG: hypothetical protein EKK48_12325 [Candidatus Melainabacteria bacterium]|nr:MAG: hypothetical protein EKK48_12325 [Candidatus Melainabacteria bacterium]